MPEPPRPRAQVGLARLPPIPWPGWAFGLLATLAWLALLAGLLTVAGCSHRGPVCGGWVLRPDGSSCRACGTADEVTYSECKGSGRRERARRRPTAPRA